MRASASVEVRVRRWVLVGSVVLAGALAVQFVLQAVWPRAVFGLLLLPLYAAVKWMGDRAARGMLPDPGTARPGGEWGHWALLALPAALLQASLVAMGLGAARSAAAVMPCALYVADMAWLRPAAAPAPAEPGR